jgi:hypothetical protein
VIVSVKARIAQMKLAKRDTDEMTDFLRALNASRRAVTRELTKLAKESKEQRFQTAVESAQLDLQIIQTRLGNADPTAAQSTVLVAAHNKVIAALKKAQSLTKARSIEWKRLQVDIEGELAAIRDLKKTQKENVDPTSFQKEAFAFLQTLHGFSTSLAGNLILGNQIQRTTTSTASASSPPPTSATVPPPTRSTAPTAKIGPSGFAQIPVPSSPLPGAQPTGPRGVTAGQGNVQITLLRQILAQVTKANQGDAHPESQGQRQRGAAVGDYQANL